MQRDDAVVRVVDVDDLEQPPRVDEAAVGDVVEVDGHAELALPGEKVRGVHGPGGGRIDLVEHLAKAEEIEREEASGGDDAPHPASLDDQRKLA